MIKEICCSVCGTPATVSIPISGEFFSTLSQRGICFDVKIRCSHCQHSFAVALDDALLFKVTGLKDTHEDAYVVCKLLKEVAEPQPKCCPRCKQQGKDWEGSDPKCAFSNGVFTRDNWNCATASALRGLVNVASDSNGWKCRDDLAAGSFGVLRVPSAAEDVVKGYVVMSWYKNRGCTGQIWVMEDDNPPHPITLEEAEAILKSYEALQKVANEGTK